MQLTQVLQNLLQVFNNPFVVGMFTVFVVLGAIGEAMDWHNRSWQWLTRVMLLGGIAGSAPWIAQTVLG